jgi:hypothetical protein
MRIGCSHWNIECSISLLLPGAMTTEYTWNILFTHHFFPLKRKSVWLISSQQRFTYPYLILYMISITKHLAGLDKIMASTLSTFLDSSKLEIGYQQVIKSVIKCLLRTHPLAVISPMCFFLKKSPVCVWLKCYVPRHHPRPARKTSVANLISAFLAHDELHIIINVRLSDSICINATLVTRA